MRLLTTTTLVALLTSVSYANELTVEAVQPEQAEHAHHHHRHKHSLHKRGGQCQFPKNEGLVSVTPNQQNAGWAMSPDQPCKPGNWCPYACPPGQVSMQWDPSVKTYSYPGSQYGGLYCEDDGTISKPIKSNPYCADGTGKVKVRNKCGKNVAFCQTVLPGNEAMLIPTNINSGNTETIAVPDPSYWASTAAHYYINPPGVSTQDGCVWGTKDKPQGNWTPYVAGANTDADGNTFVKIGWNPIYLEKATPFRNERPSYGVRVVCDGGNCNGTPCEIDPSKNDVNEVTSDLSADGAGDGAFCVVTASNGATAHIEVFEVGSGSGSSSSSSSSGSSSSGSSSSSSEESSSSAAESSTEPSSSAGDAIGAAVSATKKKVLDNLTGLNLQAFDATAGGDDSSSAPQEATTTQAAPTTSSIKPTSSSVAPTTSSAVHTTSSSSKHTTPKPTTTKNTHDVSFVSDLYKSSRTALYNLAEDSNVTTTSGSSSSSQGSSVANSSSVATTTGSSSSTDGNASSSSSGKTNGTMALPQTSASKNGASGMIVPSLSVMMVVTCALAMI